MDSSERRPKKGPWSKKKTDLTSPRKRGKRIPSTWAENPPILGEVHPEKGGGRRIIYIVGIFIPKGGEGGLVSPLCSEKKERFPRKSPGSLGGEGERKKKVLLFCGSRRERGGGRNYPFVKKKGAGLAVPQKGKRSGTALPIRGGGRRPFSSKGRPFARGKGNWMYSVAAQYWGEGGLSSLAGGNRSPFWLEKGKERRGAIRLFQMEKRGGGLPSFGGFSYGV